MNKVLLKLKTNPHVASWLCLFGIVSIGLYLRVSFALNVHFSNFFAGSPFGHDEFYYIKMAKDFLSHGTFGYMAEGVSNAYVTPGYPLFLICMFGIFGDGPQTILYIKLVQAVISTLTIVLAFFIGNKIANAPVGLLSALFIAIYPPFILHSRNLLTETIFIFLLLSYILVQHIAFNKGLARWHFASGLLFAVAVLVRPLMFALLLLPYIYVCFAKKEMRGKQIRQFLIYLLGIVLLMAPWWIRNYITLHRLVLLCTQSNPFYEGIIRNATQLPPSDKEIVDGIKLLFNQLLHHPLQTIQWFTFGKLTITFGSADFHLQQNISSLSSLSFVHYIILASGILGTLLSIFEKELRFISIYIVCSLMLQLLFLPVQRYALPFMAIFSITGAYMIWYTSSAVKRRFF